MSFHSSLIAVGVWPADLVTAGVVTVAAQVYAGRRPRDKIDRRGEVWLERLEDPPSEGGGFQRSRRHAYRVHVRYPLNGGPDQSGKVQLDVVEAHMQTIRDRYDAAVPFSSTFSGMLPVDATEENTDVDPEAEDVIDGVVRVVFTVRE